MSKPPDRSEGGDTDRIRRALLANLRHELRTPLNAVIGYSEMLLEDLTDSENLCSDLRKIHSAGSQLLTLVNDALDPARKSLGANLRHELRTPIKAVIEHSERLQEEVEALGQEEFVPDLQKIHSAAERFLSMIDEVADFSRIEAGSEMSSHLRGEASDASAIVWNAEGSPKDAGVRTDQNPLLIVDDNDVNRDVLVRHLGRQGYSTAAAENPTSAGQCHPRRARITVALAVSAAWCVGSMFAVEALGAACAG